MSSIFPIDDSFLLLWTLKNCVSLHRTTPPSFLDSRTFGAACEKLFNEAGKCDIGFYEGSLPCLWAGNTNGKYSQFPPILPLDASLHCGNFGGINGFFYRWYLGGKLGWQRTDIPWNPWLHHSGGISSSANFVRYFTFEEFVVESTAMFPAYVKLIKGFEIVSCWALYWLSFAYRNFAN